MVFARCGSSVTPPNYDASCETSSTTPSATPTRSWRSSWTPTSSPALQVRDDGPGIPAEDRERVFERFTRLDDARARDAGGTGLGLAIVRQIVDRHGGRIEVDDAPGGGAIVTVKLPLSR